MTMSAPGPYQSKLFNFLNRQSIQWGSRLTQAARRLKITVEWGSQIALYPLYLLVQTSRVAVRQIAAAQTERKRLALAEAATQTSDFPISISGGDGTTQPPLQGIACDLKTQDILFVDQDNHTVEPQQSQTELQRQISFHLGSVNYQKRQQDLASQTPNPRILPPVHHHNPRLLAPVRWLMQGLSWLEQSPVAIAIDLFGESHWHTAVVPPEIYSPQLLPPLPLAPVLKPLDQRLAQLEQRVLAPTVPAEALPPLQRFFRNWFKIQPATSAITTPDPVVTPKPWLTWADLFQAKTKSAAAIDQANLNSPQAQLSPLPPLITTLDQPISRPESGAIATVESQTQSLTQPDAPPNATEIEAKPEWIEAEALSVGYEQHFLERLLKAVDHLLAWVEHTASQLFKKLNQLRK
ncbi:hypothetical protein [Picosynechococcus sp. PCC 11901]|uniref:hypothetical protein n=2 Tax=Picosynechococcus sp. PCC 11901 TaxID=2579791 RepID=UPI0010FD8975|nr:hypothetical protein [Picosynechococcus sp. PCC 11901]